jgi:hypothetical protein
VWIGGSDLLVEGEWTWAKYGGAMEYSDWFPGEPNSVHTSAGGEDCLDVMQHEHFQWNDDVCEFNLNFMCEAP